MSVCVLLQALLNSQDSLRQYVPGLTFNLGFCGYYYDKGLESEVNGSKYLVEQRDHFWWFGHIYNHYQPHSVTEQDLRKYISQNLEFAKQHSIQSLPNCYSVSPHHSGVYPPHLPLYRAWAELLNVTVTTTEEYPHLYPSYRRRGYVYQGIMVNIKTQDLCMVNIWGVVGCVALSREGGGGRGWLGL